ncbi:alpha/beta hydrolase [Williamsia sp.]|uniref:alpha/beta hydrolase n=1 Tax=Williamsia sp. TaxID=1872085 RepID=UPI001A327F90|nr:alpha/beta hydrolase [Williamsia sp.]MBJ7287964.1 alpha/beta hydrolase [Williamsia sp.]
MTDDQKRAVAEMLRTGPLDLGGELHEQRRVLVEMLTGIPLPDDVIATSGHLGDIDVVSVDIAGVSADDVVLYLHGGAYALGTAASSVGLVADLMRRAGVRGVSVDYRLAPESPYPAALDDAVASYEALLESTDPRRIALVGESAGGGLVLATLVALRARGVPMPASAVVFSPWADLTLSGRTIHTKSGVDPALTAAGLRTRAADYVGSADPTDPLVSAVHADLTGLPPLLVQAGSDEILLDDALRVVAAAAMADVAVTLQITPGVPHVFQAFAAILTEGAAALDAAGEFLRAHFGKP